MPSALGNLLFFIYIFPLWESSWRVLGTPPGHSPQASMVIPDTAFASLRHNWLTVGAGAEQSLGPAAHPWDRKGVWTGCIIVLEPRYPCSNLFPLTY